MRGGYHFPNFPGGEIEAERGNMPYTTDLFFPQKRWNGFNQDHLHENNALSYSDTNYNL